MKEQRRLGPSPLEHSSFSKAHDIRPGHNDMVEHPDTDNRKGVLELPRKHFISTGRLSDTRAGDYAQGSPRQRCISVRP